MWRSFFFAVGIGLMVLGVEALVFEKIVIDGSAKLPRFFSGLYENGLADGFETVEIDRRAAIDEQRYNSNGFALGTQPQGSGSQFGPSRFSGPQFSGSQYGNYGGGRVDLSRSGLTQPFARLAGNRNSGPSAYPVSFGNSVDNTGANRIASKTFSPRTVVTKDWMPWSLLAAGAITFLYTSSHRNSYGD